MKRLLIVSTMGGLVLAGALTISLATASDAVAADDESHTATEVVDLVLSRLVDSGVISQEKAEEIRDRILDNPRFQRFASEPLPEQFDQERFENRLDQRIERRQEWRNKAESLDKEELRKKFEERRKQAANQRKATSQARDELRSQLEGVPREDIRNAMKNGTLNDLVDEAALTDAVLADAEARLALLVENGKITQAEADEKLAALDAKLAEIASGDADASELYKRNGLKKWQRGKDRKGANG